ncbi:MAG: tRNA (guanosine(37)-N1)-methyltransferase TrmD [Trueperaceae bacterium]
MRFTIYTLFPDLLEPYLREALLARAVKLGLVDVQVRDLRRFAGNRTGRVDDTPYGGGAGMVMRVDVAGQALAELAQDQPQPDETILLSPAGQPLTQGLVQELAGKQHIALIAGRYEGFDARTETLVTREVSIGDYVLMGGELPALVLVEAVARLLPGVLGDAESHLHESFSTGLLDYPEYTRPAEYQGLTVPDVLLSGHHGNVAAWRRLQALKRTFKRRPDLLKSAPLSEEERALIDSWSSEAG